MSVEQSTKGKETILFIDILYMNDADVDVDADDDADYDYDADDDDDDAPME